MSTPSAPTQLDPPLPNRTSPVRQMTADEARSATMGALAIGGILLVAGAALWYFGVHFWGGLCAVLGLVLCASAFMKKSLISACPFCGAPVKGITEKVATLGGSTVRCNACFEYSTIGAMRLKPLEPGAPAGSPKWVAPAFEGMVFPPACALCGEPPVRFDELKSRNVGAVAALAGRLRLTTATLKGVPYCAQHKDAVDVAVNQQKQVDLAWRSLRMMRRYLAANRGKTSIGSALTFNVEPK